MSNSLPSEAKVIVVGGGVIGASVAYHLAKFGCSDVVLLEQNELAGGTTWHAAGLVGRLRTSNSMTRINKYSAELYATLEKETGHPTGWKQVGSLIAGKSEARMIQLQRTAAMAELFGVDVHLIDRDAALQKWPLLRVDDLLGAAWLPHDGKVIPKEVCLAMAKGAEKHGAQIIEHVRVDQLEQEEGAVSGVVTNLGRIRCEHVVLCGGMWTREIALRCGITVPLYPVEHHYIVSEPIQGAFDELPVGRDPDLCIYFRGEGDAVMLGAFQKYTKPWKVDRVPDDFSFKLLEPDWQKYQEPLAAGKWRIPALENAKFAKFVNGPESFTPDNNFIMGEAPEVRNLFVVAGLNSVGIASAGGAGKYLAEWLLEGQPTMDLWSVDIRRFGRFANNLSFLRERVTEVLGLHYQMAWPNREFETGRGLRKTAIHERLAVGGASFGAKNGWERPNWFARDGMKAQTDYSFGRQNWFECHAAEHRAARESVAIFDQSGFSKLRCQGPDALPLLQQLCGNDMDVEAGRIVYTGMFNKRGGFESDLTVVRLRNEVFYIITGTAQAVHDMDWLRRNVATGERVEITDVTESFGVLGVMGPNSRELLQSLSDSDLSNAAFPFGTARQISLGTATALALRITYVGELGWELHVPISQLALLYDTLMEAGKKFGITNAGHYAINSLRLEKGYRAWGADISPDDTPLEADLAFVITWDKDIPFIGRQSLLKQKANGLTRRLVTFVLQDPEPVLWGSEPIYRNGQPVGYTTSGSYGHTLGAAIGMGYVRNQAGVTPDFIRAGKYEIGVNGRRYPATPHLRAPYDPERKRILS
jgi:glycine cleavage system aminomethyltransferase T/glycine/D-amino acid oxidase-like deaminating enzyme